MGYEVVGLLARQHGAGRPKSKFHAEYVELNISGEKVILLSPFPYIFLRKFLSGVPLDIITPMVIMKHDSHPRRDSLSFKKKSAARADITGVR